VIPVLGLEQNSAVADVLTPFGQIIRFATVALPSPGSRCASVAIAPAKRMRQRQGANFCFSTPAFLKRHRKGCAGVGEPDLAPFPTPGFKR
jgi:hypothetical protein